MEGRAAVWKNREMFFQGAPLPAHPHRLSHVTIEVEKAAA